MTRPLPHSREADVAANREARLSARQFIGLWYSALWRLLAGLPLAVGGAALAWQVPLPSQAVGNFMFMAIGVGLVGYGTYLSWRAFSFVADAITRTVTAAAKACIIPASCAKNLQAKKVIIAIPSTEGTKIALMRSAMRWIGARDPCASRRRRTICDNVLSAPRDVARY